MLPEVTSEMLKMMYEALGGGVARLLIRFFVFFGVLMAFLVMTTKLIEVFTSVNKLAPYGENIANVFVAIFLIAFFIFLFTLLAYWIAPRFSRAREQAREVREQERDGRMDRMEQDIALIKRHLGIEETDDGEVHTDD